MVDLDEIAPAEGPSDAPGHPRQHSVSAENSGMGDMLRFDAERLRILVERHLLHTGSARAREILDNWDACLPFFVKVMPKDYRRALSEMAAAQAPVVAAAE
jgi:glutamate synthase (NADPH/NADH) large chain